MKKIAVAIILMSITAYFSACERNDLYIYKDDSAESLLLLNIEDPGPPPPAIYLYRTSTQHQGALGGRIGADALCAAGAPAGTSAYHAFLSVSASDTMRGLLHPAHWNLAIPVTDGTGTNVIASSWADLFDGSILMPLHSNAGGAGILPFGDPWWSGSNTDGTYNTENDNCSNWTLISGFTKWGSPNVTDGTWINLINQGCSVSSYVLCVAY